MKNVITGVTLAGALATSLFANETFNGIGATIVSSTNGAKIVSVVPGTPAAETKLQAGDEIIAVDGEKLKGLPIENVMAQLRGQKNKPLEIIFISGGDTLSSTLRRAQITVKTLEEESVQRWNGSKAEISGAEAENYASATEADKRLVAVLQKGVTVQPESQVSAKALEGVYVEQQNEFQPKSENPKASSTVLAVLKNFDRNTIEFELKTAGKATISIINADGIVVAKLVAEHAQVGLNSINWNSEGVVDGRYMLSIEHSGSVNSKYIVLK